MAASQAQTGRWRGVRRLRAAPAIALLAPWLATAQEAGDAAATARGQPATPQVATIPAELPQQDPNAVELEEVVVTASKRAKSQRDIPGSVGAIRGEDLEKMHAQGLKDYLKLVPGVSYADQGNEESVPIIRGIATDISFGATQLTTGIYLDDMPFADLFGPSSAPDLNPFDLERVEVLKGPQGTLFGSGALAGAIRYIVEKPHFGLWEAKLSETLSQSTHSGGGLSTVSAGAVNIPIGHSLALRAVGIFRKDAGLYDMKADRCTPDLPVSLPAAATSLLGRVPALPVSTTIPIAISSGQLCAGTIRNDPDADQLRQTSWRVLAAWNPVERFKASAFYFAQRTHQNDLGLVDNPESFGAGDFPFPSPRDHEFGGGNLLLTYDFDWARLLSSTNRMTKHNYADNHQEWAASLGQQDLAEVLVIMRDDVRGWTQEIRLSSPEKGSGLFEWLVGASYLHYGNDSMQYTYIGPDLPDPQGPDDVSQVQRDLSQVFATADQLATEKALFGEITGHFGKHWELTAGARRYRTALRADTVLCGAQNLVFFQSFCTNGHFTDEANGLNPKFSIRYIHNRHVQWYVLAAKGFQFGGIQVNPPGPGFEQSANAAGFSFAPYKSSKLWNYESGIRTEWLAHRLRFDVGVFYLDWRDLQISNAVPYLVTNLNLTVIANVSRAHSMGMEAMLEALPFRGAKWVTSLSLINAVIDRPFDENNQAGPVPAGARLPGTPKFQLSNVFSYEAPLVAGWTLGPALTHSHIGASPDALRAKGTVGGYDTVDARLVLANRRSRFVPELSLGVNNIGDVRGVAYHLQVNNLVTGVPIDVYHFIAPRTAVASLSLRF